MNKTYITANRLRYWESLKGKKHTSEHNHKIGIAQIGRKKGKSYEQMYGLEKSIAIKEKLRKAKLGKKMPWNSVPERIGEKSPRWIKDRTKVKLDKERGGPLHKQWSRSVKIRDNWKCKIADQYCNGKVIAHHILSWKEYPELRYKLENGITLCHAHHPRRRAEEKRLVSEFQRLVSVSK